jgi:hypothetical protein
VEIMVNPLDLSKVENLISKESKEKYFRYWKYYVKDQKITEQNPPTKESVFEFLKNGAEGEKKYAPTTLWTIFSCLNKLLQHLYDFEITVSLFFIKLLVFGEILTILYFDYRKV